MTTKLPVMTKRERICPGGEPVLSHRFSALDLNYINTGNVIAIAYVFAQALNAGGVKNAVQALVTRFPALAGRIDIKNCCLHPGPAFVPLTHTQNEARVSDFEPAGKNIRCRRDFADEPKRSDVIRGRAPLMSVRLTSLSCGGSVLGITISHGLVDAKGFHTIVGWLSDVIAGKEARSVRFGGQESHFETGRPVSEWKKSIEDCDQDMPPRMKGIGGGGFKLLMEKGLDRIRAQEREMIYFSKPHITKLKEAVLRETSLDWISTHNVISAHILHVLIALQFSRKSRMLGIGNVVNVRGRINNADLSEDFVGNALYIMISKIQAGRPISSLSRAEIAHHLHDAFLQMDARHIERRMANIADSLAAGFGYPGLNLLKPIMAVNNQIKFDVYAADFGCGQPIRVIPQDVGDHVMIFPSREGGAEIYMRDFTSMRRQKKMLTPFWQSRFHSIQSSAGPN